MGRQRGRSKGKRAACRGVGSNIKSLTRQAGRDSSVHVSGLWCRARLPSQCWQYLFIGIPPTLLLPLLLLLLLLLLPPSPLPNTSPGDEVVDPGTEQLGPGQIRDCNRAMLLAAAAAAGGEVVDLGIARDVEGHLEGCVDKALAVGADVRVTSGERTLFWGGVCTSGLPVCCEGCSSHASSRSKHPHTPPPMTPTSVLPPPLL